MIDLVLIAVVTSIVLVVATYFAWTRIPSLLVRFGVIGVILLWWRDLAISPLVTDWIGHDEGLIDTVPTTSDILMASVIVSVGHATVIAGILIAHALLTRRGGQSEQATQPELAHQAFIVAAVIFVAGVAGHVVTVFVVSADTSLQELATNRGIFSSEASFSSLYNYARIAAGITPIGATAMLLFSAGRRRSLLLALAAVAAATLIQIALGGRVQMFAAVLLPAIVFHFGVREFRRNELIAGILILILALTVTEFYRSARTPSDLTSAMSRDLLTNSALDDAIYARAIIPEFIPHMGYQTQTPAFSHNFPTVDWPRWRGIWDQIRVDYLIAYGLKGWNWTGNSGRHYSPGAEHYMAAGWDGVLVVGILVGLFHGAILTIASRHRNPFVLLLGASTLVALLLPSFDGRMVAWIGGFGMGKLIPVGLLAIATTAPIRDRQIFVGLGMAFALFFMVDRVTNSSIMGIPMAVVQLFIYFMSIRAIIQYTRKTNSSFTPNSPDPVR